MNLYKFNHIPLLKIDAQLKKKKEVTKKNGRGSYHPNLLTNTSRNQKKKKKRLLLGKQKLRERERERERGTG